MYVHTFGQIPTLTDAKLTGGNGWYVERRALYRIPYLSQSFEFES